MTSRLNDKLRERYVAAFTAAGTLGSTDPNASSPHLISIPDGYEQSRRKLMIVGQETFGWGQNMPKPYDVDALMNGYREFNLGGAWRRTPFWQGAVRVHRGLNGDAAEGTYLWSNLVKLDVDGRRPEEDLLDRVLDLRLLQAEIEVTSPQVVVFFTGPNYDDVLKRSFREAAFQPIEKGLDRVTDGDGVLPTDSFRTYHPNYLRQSRKWWLIDRIVAEVIRAVEL